MSDDFTRTFSPDGLETTDDQEVFHSYHNIC